MTGYRPALDGLRAIAIAAVVGYHAFDWPANGGFGVDLFFVLSGFLITTILIEEHRRTGAVSLIAFYRRRAYRLLPALVVMLAVFAAVTTAAGDMNGDAAGGIAAGLTYVMNLGVVSDVPFSLTPLWSLALEEQFYLVVPPVLFGVLRGRVRLALAVVLAAAAVSAFQGWRIAADADGSGRLWCWPDTRGLPILIGCAAALLLASRPSLGRHCRWLLGPLLVWIVASTLFHPATLDDTFRGPLLSFSVLCAIAVLGAYEGGDLVSRLLSTRPLVFTGRISYSLYLWHLPVIVAVVALLGDGDAPKGLAVAVAVGVAACSFYLVEQPLRRRGRESASHRPERRLAVLSTSPSLSRSADPIMETGAPSHT